MIIPASLPDGLLARPVAMTDLDPASSLFEVAGLADRGEVVITRDDLESGWRTPDWDIHEETIAVFEGEDLLAYAEVHGWRAEAVVHPAARGRGIGSALVDWTEAATLALRMPDEEARIGQTIKEGQTDAIELLTSRGYTWRHTSWVLRLPREVVIEDRPIPAGYQIRRFEPEEEHQVFRVIEDAFNEWPDRASNTFEKWQSWTTKRTDFDPSLLQVVVHEGRVVGASVGLIYPDEGWVHQIAVHREHRHRGLAQALLRTSFEQLRAFDLPDVGLSTDSRTGALDLYLKVGMVVRDTYTHYSKLLRPAVSS